MPAALPPNQRRARGHALWIVALFVWGLLAPGVSVALAQARDDYSLFQDICRSSASRQGSAQGDTGAMVDLLAKGHCPACHIPWQDAAPPVAPAVHAPLRNDLRFSLPQRFWQAPVTAHAWRAAPARAPPHSA